MKCRVWTACQSQFPSLLPSQVGVRGCLMVWGVSCEQLVKISDRALKGGMTSTEFLMKLIWFPSIRRFMLHLTTYSNVHAFLHLPAYPALLLGCPAACKEPLIQRRTKQPGQRGGLRAYTLVFKCKNVITLSPQSFFLESQTPGTVGCSACVQNQRLYVHVNMCTFLFLLITYLY